MSVTVTSYVKQFYKGYAFGAVQAERKGYDNQSLVSADMQAVKSALKELRSYDYKGDQDDDEDEKLFKRVQAYVSTYNNFVDSTGEIGNDELDRRMTKLKKMTKKYSSELADLGIKIQNNGKMKIDKDKLEASSRNKVRKVFSEDSEYGEQVEKHIKQVKNMIRLQNLGAPVSRSVSKAKASEKIQQQDSKNADSEDAQLVQLLAEALDGKEINYTA